MRMKEMGRSNDSNTASSSAVCPFMKEEANRYVKCESPVNLAMNCTLTFRTIEDKDKHTKKFCNTFGYIHCPLAIQNDLKY